MKDDMQVKVLDNLVSDINLKFKLKVWLTFHFNKV